MLETAKERVQNREKSLPALSDKPAREELQELLEYYEPVATSFFKKVYETEEKVIKLPAHPGSMDGAEIQVNRANEAGIAPETDLEFYNLRSNGYRTETPVITQDKYDCAFTDLAALDIEMFLDGAIETIDTALENNVVLQDAKITNFGLFDEQVNYIDIADKEALICFNPPEFRSEDEKRVFLGKISSMYDSFTRTVSHHTDHSREQVIHYMTRNSPHLDENIDIELPEYSLKTGLEQRLSEEVTGSLENSY